MKEIFEKRDENRNTRDRYKLDLNIPRRNQVMFGTKILKFYETLYQLISKLQKNLMLLKI